MEIEELAGIANDFRHAAANAMRRRFTKTYIADNGYDLELATSQLADSKADLIAFGRPFIANPDLVERLQSGALPAEINPATIYGGGAAGYTDYPRFTETSGS